ncbi:MAG: 4a-hydroxytetrahydrobiopterin dehydratase [Beijerinckiaceae bacterium]|nr:4a-hydroxytetrahydrobiopterin dehydratase [Beijerinckiaceae bacterium]MDO9441037.1 4a-hydroxytetrahydrobiopterin dehydratase [Beijerinckiaceae bacterium]
MSKLRVFDENEISARLARDLPKWTYENGAISRTFRTENWKGALMVVNTIGHLAEAAWHHPDLHVTYSSVTVRLNTHDAGGVTDRDMALASRIEDVVMWRPGLTGGPLESAPAGPAYAYLHYDD